MQAFACPTSEAQAQGYWTKLTRSSFPMQSKAKDVASYLDEVPPERRDCLEKLRKLCRGTLKGYAEAMTRLVP